MSTVQRLTTTRNLRVGKKKRENNGSNFFFFLNKCVHECVCVCACVYVCEGTALTGDQMTRGGGQTSRLNTVVDDRVSCFV